MEMERLRLSGGTELSFITAGQPSRPALLLLHGTASSTVGSFGKLWTPPNGAGLPGDFESLAASHTLLG